MSRKQTYDLCKMQYRFKYHLKVPSPEAEPFYFIYGKIVHKIAEEWVGAGGGRLLSEVARDVLDGRIEVEEGVKAPKLPADYLRRLPEHLRSVQKLTDRTGFGGQLEYDFEYDLDPPNRRLVVGFIDRLVIQDDKYWIFDYKTSKDNFWRKTPKTIVSDLQLRCYARIVQKQFGAKPENIKAALYYLEGANMVGATFSEASLEAVERELLDAYVQIENTDPDHVCGRVGDHCKRCSYRAICPTYSLT